MPIPVRRILAWSLIGLAVAAIIGWSFWPQPVPVDLAAVARGPFQVSVEDQGRTRVHDPYVVSAPVAGRLLRVSNRPGDNVVAGETIVAQLQPSDPAFLDARTRAQAEAAIRTADAARRLAGAALVEAQAVLDHADAELRRVESMAARDLIAKAALEDAQLQHRQATVGLETARSALSVRQYELENARMLLADFSGSRNPGAVVSLKAPVTGRVFRVLQQSEAVVAIGTPILEIGDAGNLEVIVELLSTDAVKVRAGAAAAIKDWGGPRELAARVRLVEPSGFTKISALGVEEQRVRAILDIVEPRSEWQQLGDGFRVNARIVVSETADAVRVPMAALFRAGDNWQTFVVQNGRAALRPVSVVRTNDLDAEIVQGLQPGERVILHPSDRIRDGVSVVERPE